MMKRIRAASVLSCLQGIFSPPKLLNGHFSSGDCRSQKYRAIFCPNLVRNVHYGLNLLGGVAWDCSRGGEGARKTAIRGFRLPLSVRPSGVLANGDGRHLRVEEQGSGPVTGHALRPSVLFQ